MNSQPLAEACPVRLLRTRVNPPVPGSPHGKHTEVRERVLQFIHELDEIDIHA